MLGERTTRPAYHNRAAIQQDARTINRAVRVSESGVTTMDFVPVFSFVVVVRAFGRRCIEQLKCHEVDAYRKYGCVFETVTPNQSDTVCLGGVPTVVRSQIQTDIVSTMIQTETKRYGDAMWTGIMPDDSGWSWRFGLRRNIQQVRPMERAYWGINGRIAMWLSSLAVIRYLFDARNL